MLRLRHRARTRRLAVAAGATTLALAAFEVARMRRPGRASAHGARGIARRGGLAARKTARVVRVGYRSGSADEAALLVELEDVYWSEQGVLSIDIAFGATSLLAVLALVARVVRRGTALTTAAHRTTAPTSGP